MEGSRWGASYSMTRDTPRVAAVVPIAQTQRGEVPCPGLHSCLAMEPRFKPGVRGGQQRDQQRVRGRSKVHDERRSEAVKAGRRSQWPGGTEWGRRPPPPAN